MRTIAPKGFKGINIPKRLHKRLNRERGNLSHARYIEKVLDENKRFRENDGHLEPQTPQDSQNHDGLDGEFEKWYSDCPFAVKQEKKQLVFCQCHYPSVKKWLPRNRLVSIQACDNCWEKVCQYESIHREKKMREGAWTPQEPTANTKPLLCSLADGYFKTESELPCRKFSEYRDCPNVKCEFHLRRSIAS